MTSFYFTLCIFIPFCLKLILLRSLRRIEWQDIFVVDWQIIRKKSFLKCLNLKVETTKMGDDRQYLARNNQNLWNMRQ